VLAGISGSPAPAHRCLVCRPTTTAIPALDRVLPGRGSPCSSSPNRSGALVSGQALRVDAGTQRWPGSTDRPLRPTAARFTAPPHPSLPRLTHRSRAVQFFAGLLGASPSGQGCGSTAASGADRDERIARSGPPLPGLPPSPQPYPPRLTQCRPVEDRCAVLRRTARRVRLGPGATGRRRHPVLAGISGSPAPAVGCPVHRPTTTLLAAPGPLLSGRGSPCSSSPNRSARSSRARGCGSTAPPSALAAIALIAAPAQRYPVCRPTTIVVAAPDPRVAASEPNARATRRPVPSIQSFPVQGRRGRAGCPRHGNARHEAGASRHQLKVNALAVNS
jgi:hypothetical protein